MKTIESVIISGGGTGGHIFPALSIADEIKRRFPQAKIHFIGAQGRMEMEKVPAAGYSITGLPVRGFNRSALWRNVEVLWLLVKSLQLARRAVREHRPQVVIGVGGYASGPTLWAAQRMGIPTLIQEQNSYAGVTNKLLARGARCICVAYPGMERFFPADRLVLTGNPIRMSLFSPSESREEAFRFFGLDPNKRCVLLVGGSLGARALNEALLASASVIEANDQVQWLWQCGGYYKDKMEKAMAQRPIANVVLMPFIYRMDLAYAVADVIVSRAGAGTISELAVLGKPAVLVPSPNVSEDHQTQNALALVREQGALLVSDATARDTLVPQVMKLMDDAEQCTRMSANIQKFSREHAARDIVDQISNLL